MEQFNQDMQNAKTWTELMQKAVFNGECELIATLLQSQLSAIEEASKMPPLEAAIVARENTEKAIKWLRTCLEE